ncbi:MAG: ATP-dependent helicase [Pseudomonadota bacterium]
MNAAQYEAVTSAGGPILVVAGAGSGKTRTLVHRVAYLVEQGIPPEEILLLTFTRKAASQMLERAAELVGASCTRVSGGTFHSLAHELLRRWAGRLGFANSFGVMDRGDMEEVLGQLRKQGKHGEKDRAFPKRGTVATIISKAINKSISVEELMLAEFRHLGSFIGAIKKLAEEYEAFKRENSLMDFDDLLVHLLRLLDSDEEARRAIASSYRYVMVDEYQDTNLVQAAIVRQLAKDHRNIMVVGDDAQSIYSFRGASFKNIMEFPQMFSGTKIVRLEENYRSRQPILDLTNHIISRARDKFDKKLYTKREGGERPRLLETANQMEQSLFVCRKIKELLAAGIEPSGIAVLFRAARDSFKLEVELTRNEIGFVKYGGRRFLESAHVKDLLSFLRVSANPADMVSLTRVLLLLDGLGPKTAGGIATWVEGRRDRLMKLDDYPGGPRVKSSLAGLTPLMANLAGKGEGIQTKVDRAWEYYHPVMEERFKDDFPSRLADINEFLAVAKGYQSMSRFLADMALEPPNASGSRGAAAARDSVVLSTVHSAKGLEWKAVFIIWAAEGRFPPSYVDKSPENLEEERRLMYVAATRAEDYLYFIRPVDTGEAYGPSPIIPQLSRFLADAPTMLLACGPENDPPGRAAGRAAGPTKKAGLIPAGLNDGEFNPGQRVSHPVFGLGRVQDLKPGRKIVVDFDNCGTKTLHLDFAGLKNAG